MKCRKNGFHATTTLVLVLSKSGSGMHNYNDQLKFLRPVKLTLRPKTEQSYCSIVLISSDW